MNISQLKRRRESCDVTQAELAKFSGINQATICQAERGNVSLKDADLLALEQAINAAIRDKARKLNQAMPGVFAELTA